MKKLPIFILSAALLAGSVAPGFAASSYTNLQPGSPVVRVDDNWRYHNHDHDRGYYRSDWRGDRDRGWHHHHHGRNAAAIIGGLAAGAIIGGALAPERHDRYYDDY